MRSLISRLVSVFTVPDDNEDLAKAQFIAYSRQIPMMYLILLTSTWTLAFTHMIAAPAWLTIAFPTVFTGFGLVRIVLWWRARAADVSARERLLSLRRTNVMAGALAISFSLWALSLVEYGNAYQQSHVAFYMAITVVCCISSLMHLRSAAVIVTVIVLGCFVVYFASTGRPTFVALAINFVFVGFGLVTMLSINYRNFITMLRSQSEAEALSRENLRLANLDSLTGLPNRRAFFEKLEQWQQAAENGGPRFVLGVLDLDGFKPVNDTYGHSAGDRLLSLVAERLKMFSSAVPVEIFVARLGGDEFAFLAPLEKDIDFITAETDRVCEGIRAPFVLPEASVTVSGTLGVALSAPGVSATDLFDRADYALYEGKISKRGLSTMFSDELEDRMRRESRIEHALRNADVDAELTLAYQAIIDVDGMRVNGFEALARWQSPTLGDVSPGEFIPIAERSGIISALTGPLLAKALAAAASWPDQIRLGFNLSPQDLQNNEMVLGLIAIIEKSGFDPRRLDLEITESSFGHDFVQVQRSVSLLRQLGCGIALDDFGTGFSSLSRLHALPFTQIKIDGSFMYGSENREISDQIINSVLTLSTEMGLHCVVEGVETAAELARVRAFGGRLAQGYFFSRPVPLEQTASLLARYGGMEGAKAARRA